jgi:hypothetical protein
MDSPVACNHLDTVIIVPVWSLSLGTIWNFITGTVLPWLRHQSKGHKGLLALGLKGLESLLFYSTLCQFDSCHEEIGSQYLHPHAHLSFHLIIMLEGLPHWCTELETARCNLQPECPVGKTFQTVYREAVDGIIVSIPNSLENSEYILLLHNAAVHKGSWGVPVGANTCDSFCIWIKEVMHHGKECLGGFSNPVDKWRVCVLYYFQVCVEIIYVSTLHLWMLFIGKTM